MKILFLSPHTDDVELGSGGTLIKYIKEGHEIFWVVFSYCEDSLPDKFEKNTLKKEFLNILNNLNITQYRIFNYKVRRFNYYRQEILEDLIKIRSQFMPDLVIGPSLKDIHQDHQVIANEMIRAFKKSSSIISYEIPWNTTNFSPNLFIRLNENEIEEKWNILTYYRSQISLKRPYFNKDFILGWARFRGLQANAEFAEAFEVIKWIL